jgi:hypothetical protein
MHSSVSKKLKLEEGPGTNPSIHKQCSEYAYQSFKRQFGQTPSWNGKDYGQLKNLLKKTDITLDEFERRWDNFVSCRDEFIKKQRLSLAYFCSNFDRFIGERIPVQGGVNVKSYTEVPKY